MKPIYILMLTLCAFQVQAQLLFDDFESYNTGAFDNQWNANQWDGWQGTFSNATIQGNCGTSGTKCLSVSSPGAGQFTDLVGLTPVINSDLATISFMQFIPFGSSSNTFNLQHNYSNTSYDWSVVVVYDDNFSTVKANDDTDAFSMKYNQWIENRFELDYTIDSAYFYYDNELIKSWKLSINSTGNVASPNQINAINFFAPHSFGCTAYYDDVRVVTYGVSTEEPNTIQDIQLFPNPTMNTLKFSLSLKQPSDIQYEVKDIQGKTVMEWQDSEVSQVFFEKDLSHLSSGVYFVQIIADEQVEVRKVVVSK